MEITGKRILVVEDDYRLANALCADLRQHGVVVVGPAPTPFYAMQLLGRRGVDGAVLDVRLHGKTVFGLADELCRRGTPILFATANDEDVMPERFQGRPRITKPYDPESLRRALLALQPHDWTAPAPAPARPAPRPAPAIAPHPGEADSRTRMLKAMTAAMRRAGAERPARRSGADRTAKSPR